MTIVGAPQVSIVMEETTIPYKGVHYRGKLMRGGAISVYKFGYTFTLTNIHYHYHTNSLDLHLFLLVLQQGRVFCRV